MTVRIIDDGDAASRDAIGRQLAIDESMLSLPNDTFRFWRLSGPAVVLGRSSRVADEVDANVAARHRVDVVRRCTGGASVFIDGGCAMYSVALRLDRHGELTRIDAAHDYVISRIAAAVAKQRRDVVRDGICDLTIGGRKFSGNALRVTREAVLYHGTFLIETDLELLSSVLAHAPRQPDYRDGRDHGAFVTNVRLDADELASDLADAFGVDDQINASQFEDLITTHRTRRYDDPAWHRRH